MEYELNLNLKSEMSEYEIIGNWINETNETWVREEKIDEERRKADQLRSAGRNWKFLLPPRLSRILSHEDYAVSHAMSLRGMLWNDMTWHTISVLPADEIQICETNIIDIYGNEKFKN